MGLLFLLFKMFKMFVFLLILVLVFIIIDEEMCSLFMYIFIVFVLKFI